MPSAIRVNRLRQGQDDNTGCAASSEHTGGLFQRCAGVIQVVYEDQPLAAHVALEGESSGDIGAKAL